MYETVLSSRIDNRAAQASFVDQKATALPSNSPFPPLISSNFGLRRNRNKLTASRGTSSYSASLFNTPDGLFAVGLGAYPGKGELWAKSGTNNSSHNAMFENVQSVNKEWVSAVTVSDGLKDKETGYAQLFLPTIFAKLEKYNENLRMGLTVDPKTFFTPAEMSYIKTMPTDAQAIKELVNRVNIEEAKEGGDVVSMPVPVVAAAPPAVVPTPLATPLATPATTFLGADYIERLEQDVKDEAKEDSEKRVYIDKRLNSANLSVPELESLISVTKKLITDEKDDDTEHNYTLIVAGLIKKKTKPKRPILSRPLMPP